MIAIFQKLRDGSRCQVARWGKQMSKYISIPRTKYISTQRPKYFCSEKTHEFSSVTQKEKTPCYPTKPIRSNTNNYTFSSRKRLSIFLVEYCMCNIYSQSRNSTIIICMIYIRMSLLLSLFFPCFNLSDIYMNSPKKAVNDNQKRDGFSFLFSLSWFLN